MKTRIPILAVLALAAGIAYAQSAQTKQSEPPYVVEWVYKVKYGHQDEFWQIFKKYQIPTLNRERQLGNVLKYEVFRPSLHTSEDHRWDFRVVIYYKDVTMPSKASAIEKQLYPDRAAMQREENRRWEMTEVHWDLPIHEVDPNAPDQ